MQAEQGEQGCGHTSIRLETTIQPKLVHSVEVFPFSSQSEKAAEGQEESKPHQQKWTCQSLVELFCCNFYNVHGHMPVILLTNDQADGNSP